MTLHTLSSIESQMMVVLKEKSVNLTPTTNLSSPSHPIIQAYRPLKLIENRSQGNNAPSPISVEGGVGRLVSSPVCHS